LTELWQTTGKTLEEIDLIFAKPEIQNSSLAAQTIHHTKQDIIYEESEKV